MSQKAPLPNTLQEKKRKEEKKTNSVICRCKTGSHRPTFQNEYGSLSSSITMGKNTVQVQMLSGDPGAVGGDSTAPCSLFLSLHSCPAHPPGPGTPLAAIGAPHSPPPPLWAPPRWRAGGPSVCSSGRNLTGRGRSVIKADGTWSRTDLKREIPIPSFHTLSACCMPRTVLHLGRMGRGARQESGSNMVNLKVFRAGPSSTHFVSFYLQIKEFKIMSSTVSHISICSKHLTAAVQSTGQVSLHSIPPRVITGSWDEPATRCFTYIILNLQSHAEK